MNSPAHNASSHNPISDGRSGADHEAASSPAEATLRLIAQLPAPQGLEDRVMAGLKTAPRTARVLHWPVLLRFNGSWMRSAAAAAIVFVVAGGGWGIYTRVQPAQPSSVVAMPPHVGAAGGFSSAGAMRTPETLKGPILTQPVVAQPAAVQPAQTKPQKKAPAPVAPVKHSQTQAAAGKKASVQPAASAVK